MDWWNHLPERINPNIINIGSFQIRYYGLMYLVAFVVTYLLIMYRLRTEDYEYPKALIQKFFMWVVFAVLIGGRLGFVLFYDLKHFIAHPLEIISPFDYSEGLRYVGFFGMSYHGGLLGVIFVSLLLCYRNKINFWRFADLFSPAFPLGYTFGRIGNFLNGELYGRATSVPWGMYFPLDPLSQLRHPSQLYEAFFEGIFLFVILWSLRKKRYFWGFHFCLYIIGYGTVRFLIEFVREPNPGLGAILDFLSMGQVLCAAMILSGIVFMLIRRKQKPETTPTCPAG